MMNSLKEAQAEQAAHFKRVRNAALANRRRVASQQRIHGKSNKVDRNFASSDARSSDQKEVPLLYVDVQISKGRNARMAVYIYDNLRDHATRFSRLHQLGPQSRKKLLSLLVREKRLAMSMRSNKNIEVEYVNQEQQSSIELSNGGEAQLKVREREEEISSY